jgi:hypothetical protein
MQCRLRRHCVGCHYGPFSSSLCSKMPALQTQMEIMRRVVAHAMQAMQALRRLSLRSFLQQLMLRQACPASSKGDHIPSRCSCNTGYAGTASAVTPVLSTAAHAGDACPANSKRNHVPSKCSCNVGFAGTAWAVTLPCPGPFYSRSCSVCLPCELRWRSCAE